MGRVIQDWVCVRADNSDVIQHLETYYEPGQDDAEMMVDIAFIGPNAGARLYIETGASNEQATWTPLDDFPAGDHGQAFVTLTPAGRSVRWRFHPGAADDCACFRILLRPRMGSAPAVPGSLRDPRSPCLQPWVTVVLEGAAGVTAVQTEEFWYDAAGMSRVVGRVVTKFFTSGLVLVVETSSRREGPWTEVYRKTTIGAEDGWTPMYADKDAPDGHRFERYIRWRLYWGSGAGGPVCFRIDITPNDRLAPRLFGRVGGGFPGDLRTGGYGSQVGRSPVAPRFSIGPYRPGIDVTREAYRVVPSGMPRAHAPGGGYEVVTGQQAKAYFDGVTAVEGLGGAVAGVSTGRDARDSSSRR
ncbi:MAG: hypothetical protein FJ087_03735 [Deltaproteobacteria bacterium]|nr:hypothetical protein [Deltaproteobacteria bacterium]